MAPSGAHRSRLCLTGPLFSERLRRRAHRLTGAPPAKTVHFVTPPPQARLSRPAGRLRLLHPSRLPYGNDRKAIAQRWLSFRTSPERDQATLHRATHLFPLGPNRAFCQQVDQGHTGKIRRTRVVQRLVRALRSGVPTLYVGPQDTRSLCARRHAFDDFKTRTKYPRPALFIRRPDYIL
jgi:hypothetical protein